MQARVHPPPVFLFTDLSVSESKGQSFPNNCKIMVTNSTDIKIFYYLRKKESSKLHCYGKRKDKEKAND